MSIVVLAIFRRNLAQKRFKANIVAAVVNIQLNLFLERRTKQQILFWQFASSHFRLRLSQLDCTIVVVVEASAEKVEKKLG